MGMVKDTLSAGTEKIFDWAFDSSGMRANENRVNTLRKQGYAFGVKMHDLLRTQDVNTRLHTAEVVLGKIEKMREKGHALGMTIEEFCKKYNYKEQIERLNCLEKIHTLRQQGYKLGKTREELMNLPLAELKTKIQAGEVVFRRNPTPPIVVPRGTVSSVLTLRKIIKDPYLGLRPEEAGPLQDKLNTISKRVFGD